MNNIEKDFVLKAMFIVTLITYMFLPIFMEASILRFIVAVLIMSINVIVFLHTVRQNKEEAVPIKDMLIGILLVVITLAIIYATRLL